MGIVYSRADTAPPPMPHFVGAPGKVPADEEPEAAEVPSVNYLALPPPVKYEDIQREVMMALKPDTFEGLRFEINRPLNQNFFLSHSIFMGNIEVPSPNSSQTIKVPIGTYEFGANVISEKHFALGRITTDGRLSGRLRAELTDWAAARVQMQLANDAGQSNLAADLDIKGSDWNAQIKLGNPGFYGANYFQAVTPQLAVGGEFFWLSHALKSGVGLAARHQGEKHVATMQLATTGILSLQYAHRVTDKVMLASDFLWHYGSREATATVGYDVMLRQARLQGRIDTNGVVAAYIQERFAPGISFLLSAELDHWHRNYKFGFGFTAGE